MWTRYQVFIPNIVLTLCQHLWYCWNHNVGFTWYTLSGPRVSFAISTMSTWYIIIRIHVSCQHHDVICWNDLCLHGTSTQTRLKEHVYLTRLTTTQIGNPNPCISPVRPLTPNLNSPSQPARLTPAVHVDWRSLRGRILLAFLDGFL